MANSKYEYVRSFEQPDILLANTWIVVRIDGRGFSKFTAKYNFVKPNDRDALDLMNAAAKAVMKELPDLVLAYGNSDEYSFVFHKDCMLFERRASKLTTTIVSTFTSYYVFLWSRYFPDKPLTPPLPSFDGRAVCYPSDLNLRDYMSWRQVDCHINNLYNTTFWALVQLGGMGAREAEERLSGTVSKDKNEILFKDFGINYNNEPECFKKGTILYRDFFPTTNETENPEKSSKSESKHIIEATRPVHDTDVPVPEPLRVGSKSSSVMSRPRPFALRERAGSDPISDVSPMSEAPAPSNRPTQTFFTSTTPSPPPSPPKFSSDYPNPLRSNPVSPRTGNSPKEQYAKNAYTTPMPLSPPSTATSPRGKQGFAALTPLPLSPPILKPSTRPPMSLNAPNPTTRSNISPGFPPQDYSPFKPQDPAPNNTQYRQLHSHSYSVSITSPSGHRALRGRSPSLSQLQTYSTYVPQVNSTYEPPATLSYESPPPPPPQPMTGPPLIPVRISSIPPDAQPRKLSLQNLRTKSSLQNMHTSGNPNTNPSAPACSSSISPPNTNKDLPQPPTDESPASIPAHPHRRIASAPDTAACVHPGIAELPATRPRHPRLNSLPTVTGSSVSAVSTPGSIVRPDEWHVFPQLQDRLVPGERMRAADTPSPPLAVREARKEKEGKEKERSREEKREQKEKGKREHKDKEKRERKDRDKQKKEDRPSQMSRSARDKDRKKRSKAKVLVEHVDLIKDDFWEKRPWILSGTAG